MWSFVQRAPKNWITFLWGKLSLTLPMGQTWSKSVSANYFKCFDIWKKQSDNKAVLDNQIYLPWPTALAVMFPFSSKRLYKQSSVFFNNSNLFPLLCIHNRHWLKEGRKWYQQGGQFVRFSAAAHDCFSPHSIWLQRVSRMMQQLGNYGAAHLPFLFNLAVCHITTMTPIADSDHITSQQMLCV